MKPYLVQALWACTVFIPSAGKAQNTQAAPTGAATTVRSSRSWTEGQPVENRPPEKSDDKPAFPEQTRAESLASMLPRPSGLRR